MKVLIECEWNMYIGLSSIKEGMDHKRRGARGSKDGIP